MTQRSREALVGTVALVTGASSGISAATAAALAGHGAAVALAARRKERLDAIAAIIRERGGTALVLEADITNQQQATDAVARTVTELGRLDTLLNNAGIMLLGPALDTPIGEWERMVALNVLGSLYVTHAAVPYLARAAEDSPRQVADLVSISSTAGRVARPGGSVYTLTKFGIAAFSESLRQELISQRVRVSVVERDRRVAVNEMLVRAAEQTWSPDQAEAIPARVRRARSPMPGEASEPATALPLYE
jgi:NADP-dependent 3-hydroxy acid dehydrogenase YdfG